MITFDHILILKTWNTSQIHLFFQLQRKEVLNLILVFISSVALGWLSASWVCLWHPGCSSCLHEWWRTPWRIRVNVHQNQERVQSKLRAKNLLSGCCSPPRLSFVSGTIFKYHGQDPKEQVQPKSELHPYVQTMFACQLLSVTFSVQSEGLKPRLKRLDWGSAPLLFRP